MFTREPAVVFSSLGEIAKAVIPVLILGDVVHWDVKMTAAVMFLVSVAVSALSTVFTRSQTTPEADVNALIRTATHAEPGTSPTLIKEIQAEKDAGK
jgi:hypothetical protein